jgi:hypothetical protein
VAGQTARPTEETFGQIATIQEPTNAAVQVVAEVGLAFDEAKVRAAFQREVTRRTEAAAAKAA